MASCSAQSLRICVVFSGLHDVVKLKGWEVKDEFGAGVPNSRDPAGKACM